MLKLIPCIKHGKDDSMSKKNDNDKILDSLSLGMISDAASGMDCTGLIPFLPDNDYQLYSYNSIESFIPDPAPDKRR